jgi:hypothetical protein
LTADLGLLIFAPFIAWHAYRAGHSLKTGIFKVLLAALFATMICATLLNLGGTTLVRLFIGYVVVYVAMLVVALCRLRGPSNTPLERTGSAGRSAPGRYPEYGHDEPAGPGSATRTHRLGGSLQTR